jgi:hypothetical protein
VSPYQAKSDAAIAYEGWGTALKPAYEPIVLARKPLIGTLAENVLAFGTGGLNIDACRVPTADEENLGRWPANILHDGSDKVMDIFARFGERKSCKSPSTARSPGSIFGGSRTQGNLPMDTGTAARFFYCAKASKSERCGSAHPTVKPVKLLEWLVKLITPPGGVVLDPFAGIGSTGLAARNLGFGCILIEQDESYVNDINRRLRSSQRDESDPC